jgi:hypothetical protein
MNLDLAGKEVLSTLVEYSAVLHFSRGYTARIESPFSITRAGERQNLSPDSDPQGSFQLLEALLHQVVRRAEVDDSGALSLEFHNEAAIRVEPHDKYEAWAVSGPDGFLVVSLPGGGLAIWEAKNQSR